jgi:hypothetical protein
MYVRVVKYGQIGRAQQGGFECAAECSCS